MLPCALLWTLIDLSRNLVNIIIPMLRITTTKVKNHKKKVLSHVISKTPKENSDPLKDLMENPEKTANPIELINGNYRSGESNYR